MRSINAIQNANRIRTAEIARRRVALLIAGGLLVVWAALCAI
jgi:hypothetical protein